MSGSLTSHHDWIVISEPVALTQLLVEYLRRRTPRLALRAVGTQDTLELEVSALFYGFCRAVIDGPLAMTPWSLKACDLSDKVRY